MITFPPGPTASESPRVDAWRPIVCVFISAQASKGPTGAAVVDMSRHGVVPDHLEVLLGDDPEGVSRAGLGRLNASVELLGQ